MVGIILVLLNFTSPQTAFSVSRLTTVNSATLSANYATATFELPTDIDWVRTLRPFGANRVDYMLRDTNNITKRGKQGGCSGSLDVLAWLMSEVNAVKNSCLMIAYGELIHLYREGDFVDNTTGRYFDDDIDTFVSLETLAHIAPLEPELFRRFGWTIRFFITSDQFAVFAQLVSSCGHIINRRPGKARSSHPTIELYPIVTIPNDEGKENIVKDLWAGSLFPESMIFPTKDKNLISKGSSHSLQLQVPNQPLRLLECVYGNWKVPSGAHARGRLNCINK